MFTKLLKPVVGLLRQIGLRLIIYLDMLFMHSNKEQLETMAPLIVYLFEALGLMVNKTKSLLTPTQSLEFLGFLINSHTLSLTLPSEKSRKIQQEAAKLLQRHALSARELAMFIGKDTATSRALWQAPLHYRALQRKLNSAIAGNDLTDRYTVQILIDDEMKKDLQWWTTMDSLLVGTLICRPSHPALVLESDASQMGWGARCMETSTGGCWSTTEAQYHINYLELLAAFLALKTFANNQKGLILLKMDNVSAVTYINQKGGTHSNITVQSSPADLGVVHPERDNFTSGTPAWQSQHSSRPGILDCQGQMRLDDQSKGVPSNTTVAGATGDRPFCISTNQTATQVLQLEARPQGRGNRCFSTELGSSEGVCQSSMVLNTPLFEPDKTTASQSIVDNSTLALPTLVSSSSRDSKTILVNSHLIRT